MRNLSFFICVLLTANFAFAEASEEEPRYRISESRAQLSTESNSGVLSMVLASVDGEPITTEDLRQFLAAQGETMPANILSEDFNLRTKVKEIVTQKLLEKEAQATNISISEEEVESYMKEIQRQNNTDEAGLAELLKSRGIVLENYKKQVVADILRTRLIGQYVRSRISISDGDVQRYLEEHPERKGTPGALHIHQLLFSFDDAVTHERRLEVAAAADRAFQELRDGKAISEVAPSAYLDLGFVSADDLLPELQQPVRELTLGATTAPILTERGIYIMKMTARNDAETGMSDELRQSIRTEISQTKMKDEIERYFTEELQKKYSVEIKI